MPGRSRHSEEQLRAVVDAQVEHGLSAAEAVAAAAAGELPGGEQLEPFAISESSARHHAGAERRERGDGELVNGELAERGDDVARRLVAIIDAETRKIEQAEERDLERVAVLARAARQVGLLARQSARRRPPRAPASRDGDVVPGGFLDGLAANMARAERHTARGNGASE
jgi:hypothetical protein